MKYEKIRKASFQSRPNRFIAEVNLDEELVRTHVKNTGRCKEILINGVSVYLEDHLEKMGNRKNRYSLIAAEKLSSENSKEKMLINIDSQAPNKVVYESLLEEKVSTPGMGKLTIIKPESVYLSSRFDFYIEDIHGEKAYVEVKGVTLEDNGVARFPDAPTERGVKHIRELCKALEDGYRAYIIFIIQMKGIAYFEPNDLTHLAFGEALREAKRKGVEILAYDCIVKPDSLELDKAVKVNLNNIMDY